MQSTDLGQICNYLEISDAIATAGQPSSEQFSTIREAGYKVVINLAMPTSTGALPNEAQLVAEQGMEYIHLPVVWEAPRIEDVHRFCRIMDERRGQRVFVHCALNMRASVFVLLYRVLYQDTPLEVAQEALFQIWHPDGAWHDLMDEAMQQF